MKLKEIRHIVPAGYGPIPTSTAFVDIERIQWIEHQPKNATMLEYCKIHMQGGTPVIVIATPKEIFRQIRHNPVVFEDKLP